MYWYYLVYILCAVYNTVQNVREGKTPIHGNGYFMHALAAIPLLMYFLRGEWEFAKQNCMFYITLFCFLILVPYYVYTAERYISVVREQKRPRKYVLVCLAALLLPLWDVFTPLILHVPAVRNWGGFTYIGTCAVPDVYDKCLADTLTELFINTDPRECPYKRSEEKTVIGNVRFVTTAITDTRCGKVAAVLKQVREVPVGGGATLIPFFDWLAMDKDWSQHPQADNIPSSYDAVREYEKLVR